MKPLQINLARSPFRNDLLLWVVFSALGLGGLGLTAFNTYSFMTAERRQEKLQADLAGHRQAMQEMQGESERLRADLSKVDLDVLESQAEFVAGVLQERNFSWTHLFNALEETVPWNVKLAAIRPIFREGKINLTLNGTARNMEAFLNMQDLLQASARFGNVSPADWQQLPGNETVSFTLTLGYRPLEGGEGQDAPEETSLAAGEAAEPEAEGEGGEFGEEVVDEEPAEEDLAENSPGPPRPGQRPGNPALPAAGGVVKGAGPAAGRGALPRESKGRSSPPGEEGDDLVAGPAGVIPLGVGGGKARAGTAGSTPAAGRKASGGAEPVADATAKAGPVPGLGPKNIPENERIEWKDGVPRYKVQTFDPSKLPQPPEDKSKPQGDDQKKAP